MTLTFHIIKSTTKELDAEGKKKKRQHKPKSFPAVAGERVREAVDAAHFGVPSAGLGLRQIQEPCFIALR